MGLHSGANVPSWFAGRNILVTGATGFMGKVLVEKLLRSCPNIGIIYVLIRTKRGYDYLQRLEDLVNSMVFDKLRDTNPDQINKVVGIKGDVSQDNLGLSSEDLETLKKSVNLVFHCAANVRFDQKLKNAANLNTGGTLRLLKLVETFDRIDAFIHVSTAYCHCNLDRLEELVYPPPHPPQGVLETCKWMPPDALETITPILLGKQPNTYAYTKCLTEDLVSQYHSKFPICIARPSIVTAIWKEPLPGWVENLNGPTGLLVGAGKGVIRSMHCNGDHKADFMPVDIAINTIVVAAWHVGNTRPKMPFICNVTESGENPITWGEALDTGRKHVYNNPFSMALWYPDGSIKASKFYHTLCVIFFHMLPAYLIDGLLIILRRKPFMIRTQERIQSGLEVLQYYTTKQWQFTNDNLKMLRRSLNSEDREIFFMDISKVCWNDYILEYVLGAREYCLKEDPSTIPSARKLLKRLYYLDRFKNLCLIIFAFWFLWNYTFTFLTAVDSIFQTVTTLVIS